MHLLQCFHTQKGKLQEGLTLLRSTNSKWQVFETWQGLIQPLPGFLRVKYCTLESESPMAVPSGALVC